ncbi:MAG: NUDIX hydrolase [Cohaesibacteraceae bacterium]|nr:NUDIX hydrolase [Cohaesibacteraceae bacterium]
MEQEKKHPSVQAEIIEQTIVYDKWVTLIRVKIRALMRWNGSIGTPYQIERHIHHHGSGTCVLPIDPIRNRLLLVRQLRAPLIWAKDPNPYLVQPAAGLIDEGETPQEAILREGREELGYALRKLLPLSPCYASPGFSTEMIYPYLAEYSGSDRVQSGGGILAENEDIEVLEITTNALTELFDNNEIRDAKLLILYLAALKFYPECFGQDYSEIKQM